MLLPATRPRCLLVGVIGALLFGAGGCGDGASSPEAAVERFLAPFAEPPKSGSGRVSEEVREFWASACDRVDPRLRRALRVNADTPADPRIDCGAVVVLAVMYTGDTGQMAQPSRVSGRPVSAETSGDQSVVRVEMRYETDERRASSAPAPPAAATVNVLVVKRDGSWWIATPQAFNPRHAGDGGYNKSQLRKLHQEMLGAN